MNKREVTSPILTGLKGADREVVKAQLLASETLFKLIEEKIEKEIKDLDNITYEDFDSPSWAYKQAFKLGIKKGLTSLKKYVIIYT